MTEDPRISEIRAVMDEWYHVGPPGTPPAKIRAILDGLSPTPAVFLPGDVLPPNVAILNTDGVVYGPAPGWVVNVPGVGIQLPSASEVRALVEAKMADRGEQAA